MSRHRILVIDDDALFRSLIMALLRKDYLVSVAANGSDGYYKAIEHPPDLAIIDVQMPVWDGIQTLQAFRAHRALVNVPVVMLTGDASKETVMGAINAGANDYVIKMSFDQKEFLNKLQRLLGVESPPLHEPKIAKPSPVVNEPVSAAAANNLQSIIDDWE